MTLVCCNRVQVGEAFLPLMTTATQPASVVREAASHCAHAGRGCSTCCACISDIPSIPARCFHGLRDGIALVGAAAVQPLAYAA